MVDLHPEVAARLRAEVGAWLAGLERPFMGANLLEIVLRAPVAGSR